MSSQKVVPFAGFMSSDRENILIKSISSLKDLEKELQALYLEAYGQDYLYAYRDPKRVRRYLRWLLKHAQGGFWVAFDQGRPVAFLALQPDCRFQGETVPEIHELVVAPGYQKRGLGQRLMEEAFRFLEALGHKKVALWVGEHNDRAKKFYERLGFKETFHQGAWIRMERPLEPSQASESKSSNLSSTRKASSTSESSMVSSGV